MKFVICPICGKIVRIGCDECLTLEEHIEIFHKSFREKSEKGKI